MKVRASHGIAIDYHQPRHCSAVCECGFAVSALSVDALDRAMLEHEDWKHKAAVHWSRVRCEVAA